MEPQLEVRDLVRVFGKHEHRAVDGISLSVMAGRIHALLGPNGAGKTTLVKMCSSLLLPTSGDVFVCGVDAVRHPRRARSHLGLLLGGEGGFYPRATARQNLLFFADLAGIKTHHRARAVREALEAVNLLDRENDKVRNFSRGMVQRLHIARAIMSSPSVLILDEPTNGLDPEIALHIRELVADLAADRGMAILLTSHSMPEVEELASLITVIGAGRVVTSGKAHDIASFAGIDRVTSFSVSGHDSSLLEESRLRYENAATIEVRPLGGYWRVTIFWKQQIAPVDVATELFSSHGRAVPLDLVTRKATLEESYLALAERLVR